MNKFVLEYEGTNMPTKYTIHGSHVLAHTTFGLILQILRDEIYGSLKVLLLITIGNKPCDLSDQSLTKRPDARILFVTCPWSSRKARGGTVGYPGCRTNGKARRGSL